MRRVRARVTGRVQGVMFRDSCRREAERLGVVGWVRNEPDGAVALQAEGTDAAVDALLSWCRSGPPGARVEAVEVSPLDAAAALGGAGFEVRW